MKPIKFRKFILLYLGIHLTMFFNVRSQIVNVLDQSPEKRDSDFGMLIEGSLSLRSGNSSTLDLRSRVSSHLRKNDHLFRLILSSEFSKADRSNTANHQFLHSRWNWQLTPKTSIISFMQFEHNDKQNIKGRILIGGGLEYTLKQNNDSRLSVAASFMPEFEVLNGENYSNGTYRSRLSSYMSGYIKLSSNASFMNTTFYQPQLNDWKNFRILSESSLLIKVNSKISFKTSLDISHNSNPPEEIVQTDVTLLQGITISL